MFINDLCHYYGINTPADAINQLDEYFVTRVLSDTVVCSLYYIAACFAYSVPVESREEIIQISVWDLVRVLPTLVMKKSDAREFSTWMVFRLRAILDNKTNTYLKKNNKYWEDKVEGNRPIAKDSSVDLFSVLPAPIGVDREYECKEDQQELYDTLATLVVEEASSYVLGFWGILASIFDPKFDIASSYAAGDFSNFFRILTQINVTPVRIEQLMAALEKNHKKYMKTSKTLAQTKARVKDYKWKVRKVLVAHRELHQFACTK